MMVGQAQQDIASQMATYEITISHEIIAVLTGMLEVHTCVHVHVHVHNDRHVVF